MILVYITCKDAKEAKKISKHLVGKRLAACTNFFPIKSIYWWNGKIENADEAVVIAKTIDKNYATIKKEVKKIHSYEVPCIIKIKAEANEDYECWLKKETR